MLLEFFTICSRSRQIVLTNNFILQRYIHFRDFLFMTTIKLQTKEKIEYKKLIFIFVYNNRYKAKYYDYKETSNTRYK